MAKIKFTKTELKVQQDAARQFNRFLPTLQLKKQQLQAEIRLCDEAVARNEAAARILEEKLSRWVALFGDAEATERWRNTLTVKEIVSHEGNIAGIAIPVFDNVIFEESEPDLFAESWAADDAIAALKEAVSLRAEAALLQEQRRRLSAELRTTSQRVNLFEKVKIPECRENIRRIRIMINDQETAAVARCKIAKQKAALLTA